MASEVKSGDFVHVVATINTRTGEGKILYVNPASSTIASDASPEPDVSLRIYDIAGKVLFDAPVVVRRSSPEHDGSNDVGLIQADLPERPGMAAVSLLYNGKEVSRYEAAPAPPPAVRSGLSFSPAGTASRRRMTVKDLAEVAPTRGVTYSVQVKPDTGGPWNTIAVGRPTPHLELDGNQFPGARTAAVRVVRTTGFKDDVIAEEMVTLPDRHV